MCHCNIRSGTCHVCAHSLETATSGAAPHAGVYQEVMGSAHNMLGAPHIAEVRLTCDMRPPSGEAPRPPDVPCTWMRSLVQACDLLSKGHPATTKHGHDNILHTFTPRPLRPHPTYQ